MNDLFRYVVITPARNEERYIEKTIHSVMSQTLRPVQWIIVDDGSKDGTGEILSEYAANVGWLKIVSRKDRGFRLPGTGVIDAFYDGFKEITEFEWDFIVKLDADLSFSEDYFTRCFEKFIDDKRLGIGGGFIVSLDDGKAIREETPLFHVRGATKIYKRACWEEIEGLLSLPGWDTVDELKANMLGWKTTTFKDIEIYQHRKTGKAEGVKRDLIKHGIANYVAGYHPLFVLAKCTLRMVRPPLILGSFYIMYGFFSSYLKRQERVQDRELISFTRRQQLRRLFFMDSIWK